MYRILSGFQILGTKGKLKRTQKQMIKSPSQFPTTNLNLSWSQALSEVQHNSMTAPNSGMPSPMVSIITTEKTTMYYPWVQMLPGLASVKNLAKTRPKSLREKTDKC